MATKSTKREQRLLGCTECPGRILRRRRGKPDGWGDCGALISYKARLCPRCKMRFAEGALMGLRMPKRAKGRAVKRDWVKLFLGR